MYHIRIHPSDTPHWFGMGGILHLGPHKGLHIGLFQKDYHYIEFSESAPRITENEKNLANIGTAIKIRRTPWGE